MRAWRAMGDLIPKPPRATTGTHQDLSTLPAARPQLQRRPEERGGAGGAQDGQAGRPGIARRLLHLQLVPGLGCGSAEPSEPPAPWCLRLAPRSPLRTFHPQVVPPEAVRLEVEGERRVGLVQVDVHLALLDRLPLKDRQQHLPAGTPAPWVPQGPCTGAVPGRRRWTHPRDFFFMAGTISASMSTFRSNFRVKHSLLGSCGG